MRRFYLFPLFFAVVFSAHSQTRLDTLTTLPPFRQDIQQQILGSFTNFTGRLIHQYDDTNLTKGERIMSKNYENKFFGTWLSYVNFAKDGYPDGNSVLVAPNSASTRLRTTFAHKANQVVYNLGAEANVANNIANIISGKNAAAATSFFASVSFLPHAGKGITYDPNRGLSLLKEKKALLQKIQVSLDKQYRDDYAKDTTALHQITDSINGKGGPGAVSPTLMADYYAKRDKVKSYGLNEDRSFYDAGFQMPAIKAVTDSLQQMIDSIEISNDAIAHFHFHWFSGGFAYTRNSYTTYDGNAAFASRINSDPFDSLAFNIGFNYLYELNKKYDPFFKGPRSIYFSLNYNLARDINYAHLKQLNLFTNHNVSGGTDSVYQLQSTATGVDVTNLPEVDSWLHTFSAKAVVVFKQSTVMGIDVGLSGAYGKINAPVYSGQFGLMFRFADSQTKNTKVNFEVFLQLQDFEDSQQSGLSTWQRKVVGINASIPFSKLFF